MAAAAANAGAISSAAEQPVPGSALPTIGAPGASSQACAPSPSATAGNELPLADTGPVNEFRVARGAPSPAAEQLPDAPSHPNAPHGQIFGFKGFTLTGSPDVTLRDELPITELGATLGGSFKQGRTAYFVSLDRFGIDQQKLLTFLTTLETQTGAGALPLDANPVASSSFVARIDRQFSSRDSAYARFSRDDLRSYSLRPSQDASGPGLGTDFGVTQQAATVGNTVTLSADTLNETTARFISDETQLPAGAPAMGVQSDLPTVRRDRVFEAANNIYRQAGKQGLSAGGDFLYNQMNISFLESSLGRFSGGNASFTQSDRSAGLYVESERKLRPNLLLTSGIRYDLQLLRGFQKDTNNVAPQLGVAWAPSTSTVIRGGVGVYYDQIPLPALAGPADPSSVANLESSGRLVSRNGASAEQLGEFTSMSPSLQNSYAEQANFEIEQQIGPRSALSAESQYVRGVQLALPAFRPVAMCASAGGCNAGNTFWGREMGSGAVSSYAGNSVAFTQRPTQWGDYKVSYTYATAQDSGTEPDAFFFINDRLRRASFTGDLHTTPGPGSDLWQHIANGFVLTGTGDYTKRSEFAGLNFVNMNARLSKTLAWGESYRLDFLAETFNMLQRTNAAFANSAAKMGDSLASVYTTYQRVASFQSPNGSQLGLRLTF